jgi:uncharacterized damage-inducible protein DinB
MNTKDIQVLYNYNRWANAQMLAAVVPLTAEQFTRNLASSFASVRDTLVHMLSAEWIWLERWRGVSPPAMLQAQDFPTLEIVKMRWAEVEREQKEFLEQLAGETLGRQVGYLNTKGERWEYTLGQMLQHVVNHSTYHRGQIATMLRQLGHAPAPSDFLLFFDAQ